MMKKINELFLFLLKICAHKQCSKCDLEQDPVQLLNSPNNSIQRSFSGSVYLIMLENFRITITNLE